MLSYKKQQPGSVFMIAAVQIIYMGLSYLLRDAPAGQRGPLMVQRIRLFGRPVAEVTLSNGIGAMYVTCYRI